MRPAALRTIRDLVRAGATAIGRRPLHSPSRADLGAGDREVRQLADELWGPLPASPTDAAAKSRPRLRKVGAGRLIDAEGATTWSEIASLVGLRPDFEAAPLPEDARVHYTHRRVEGRDVYFVATNAPQPFSTLAKFRVTSGRPELWCPMTGQTRPLPEFTVRDGVTTIPLRFEPAGSYFVVFSPQSAAPGAAATGRRNFPEFRPVTDVAGAWEVAFDPAWGGPARIEFPALLDWTKHATEGIRYYSGTATYRKTIAWTGAPGAGRVWLNLGTVKNLAEVRLNGRSAGIVWKPPFRVDVTDALRRGENTLEVRVVNLWVNRLIGDERLPADVEWSAGAPKAWPAWLTDPRQPRTSGRRTFETFPHWKATDSLLPSGLLGPVAIEEQVP